MKAKIIIIFFLSIHVFAQESNNTNFEHFQIGIYALQSPPGTKGHQNGSLKDIVADVKEVNGTINASIPYRHWDRVNYPDWDFHNYFLTYMEEMYSTTLNNEDMSCIQVFSPALYSSFLTPPIKQMPENDRWADRNLDFELFQEFIRTILKKELELIINAVGSDKEKLEKILFNNKLRPLGGWYLDDEPLVRNHDIEVIETISEVIRLLEKEFFLEQIVPLGFNENKLNSFLHYRYIAFDGDDLHKYPKSSRQYDGRFYNRDGKTIYFQNNQIYSVFKPNTFDVLLLDFYHNDISFWEKMFNDIKNEYELLNREMPIVMPVINTQIENESKLNLKLEEVENLINLFSNYNFPGIWMYIWEDNDNNNLDTRFIWKKNNFELKKKILKYSEKE